MDAAEEVLSSITTGFGEVGARERPPLLGRESEISKLKQVWERVSSNGGRSPSEVVAICGPSGVGKSYLIESFRPMVELGVAEGANNEGIFVSSKFDQIAFKRSSRREPFYAVVSALSDICEILKGKKEASEIRKELRHAVGVELDLLCQFIPTFRELLSEPDHTDQVGSTHEDEFRWDSTVNKDDGLARICWAMTRLLHVAASHFPIWLHFDDVHWADTECSTLIQALIADVKSRAVVIALSYRDGAESSTVVSGVLRPRDPTRNSDLLSTTSSFSGSLRFTEVRVGNLSKDGVHALMSSILDLDRLASVEEVHRFFPEPEESIERLSNELVNLVFLKTSGNPFFVMEFLERLKLDGLLHYSSEKHSWEWSDMESMTRLDVREGVLGSIDVRLSQLPGHFRKALMVAAHLGFRFRRDVFETVLIDDYMGESLGDNDGSKSSLRERVGHVLDSAERASLLLRLDNGESFCFVHDRIQQCAYEMVGAGNEKRKLCLNLGMRLLPLLEKDNSLYFLVADLLNHGSDMITEREKRSELVKINKTAAEMSMVRAAYKSAVQYLRCAIDFLDFESMWDDSYELTLSLHNGLALASSNCSEYETCHRAAETIVMNARCVADKHTANLASIHVLTLDGKFEESILRGLEAMRELGYSAKMKPSMAFLLLRLLRTRRLLKKKSRSDMLSLPKMTHSKKLAILEVMEEMSPSISVLSKNELKLKLHEFMMATSLGLGWSVSTMYATAAFGLVEMAAFGDVKRAAELGNLALDMVARYDKEESRCFVVLVANSLLFPWTKSWTICSQDLSTSFSVGLQHGKTYLALSCKPLIALSLRLTERLTDAERIIRSSYETMKRFKVSSSLLPPMKICLQFILNMMGWSDNPAILSGEILEEGDPVCLDAAVTEAVMRQVQSELACRFGDIDRAFHFLKLLEPGDQAIKAHCPSMVSYLLWGGLTYLGLARTKKSKRRRNLRRAKVRLSSLQHIVQNGCNDARPFFHILEAEVRSRPASMEATMKLYDLAIEAAVDAGFVGYAGLACELAYSYLERRGNSKNGETSQRYWNQMMEFYDEWGAIAKIEWLRRTYVGDGLEQELDVPDVVVGQRQKSGCDELKGSSEFRTVSHKPVLEVINESGMACFGKDTVH